MAIPVDDKKQKKEKKRKKKQMTEQTEVRMLQECCTSFYVVGFCESSGELRLLMSVAPYRKLIISTGNKQVLYVNLCPENKVFKGTENMLSICY